MGRLCCLVVQGMEPEPDSQLYGMLPVWPWVVNHRTSLDLLFLIYEMIIIAL